VCARDSDPIFNQWLGTVNKRHDRRFISHDEVTTAGLQMPAIAVDNLAEASFL
jgi:hypothetical protein